MSSPRVVENAITTYLRENSGLEKRHYLGMSTIGQCPRKLYFDYVNGRNFTDRDARYCWAGYLFERDLRTRLEAAGIARPNSIRELIAPFDPRFRGHTDGETTDGALLELKSINERGFLKVQSERRPKSDHFKQTQIYMRFGEYSSALVVYVCRDTFEHLVYEVRYNANSAQALETKAKKILADIDSRSAPGCECGYCR